MARKKKKIEEVKVEEQNTTTKQPAAIGYSGKISVTAKKRNNIIYNKSYKNNGSAKLFKYISLCLIGEYTTAKNFQPTKIRLFSREDSLTPEEVRKHQEGIFGGSCIDASNFITYNTFGVSEYKEDKTSEIANADDSGTATLHFLIPSIYIKAGITNIHQICLYGKNTTLNTEYSAYYLCTKVENDIEVWDPIVLNDDNINLILDWEMTIGNK